MKAYPVFFQYIVDYDKSMKTLAVTPWKTQNQELLEKAGTTVTTTSDEETLNTVLQQIDNENNRVIYLSFSRCVGCSEEWRRLEGFQYSIYKCYA